MGKHLIQVPLGPDRRPQSPLFTQGGFDVVLLYLRLKISHYGGTPRSTRTTFDAILACAEKMAALWEIFAARHQMTRSIIDVPGWAHHDALRMPLGFPDDLAERGGRADPPESDAG
jgi:hypothetical protein